MRPSRTSHADESPSDATSSRVGVRDRTSAVAEPTMCCAAAPRHAASRIAKGGAAPAPSELRAMKAELEVLEAQGEALGKLEDDELEDDLDDEELDEDDEDWDDEDEDDEDDEDDDYDDDDDEYRDRE